MNLLRDENDDVVGNKKPLVPISNGALRWTTLAAIATVIAICITLYSFISGFARQSQIENIYKIYSEIKTNVDKDSVRIDELDKARTSMEAQHVIIFQRLGEENGYIDVLKSQMDSLLNKHK